MVKEKVERLRKRLDVSLQTINEALSVCVS
jgi:hypothetical protein